jgi:hypothetical protein
MVFEARSKTDMSLQDIVISQAKEGCGLELIKLNQVAT